MSLGIKRQRNLQTFVILSLNVLLISGKDFFLSSNRENKIYMEEYILSTCSPQNVLRVRTTDCLLFHQSKHVTAKGHSEMCRTVGVNAPEKT